MAGDWIKMRTSLWDDGRIRAIARVTQVSRSTVTGALFRLWSLADEHTTDGLLIGYGAEDIDAEVGIPGFCNALSVPEVDWLCTRDKGLQIKRFQEHNGDSAKSRAQATKRQQRRRHAHVTVERDMSVTREEKRREEKMREEVEPEPPDSHDPAKPPVAAPRRSAIPRTRWDACLGWQGITPERKELWRSAYPACDINRQLAAMNVWLMANPAKAHKHNWDRFITNWLMRSQDRGGDTKSNGTTAPLEHTVEDVRRFLESP